MRVFGVIGLLLALLIVGLLAKKQLSGVASPVLPSVPAAATGSAPAGDARAQSQQIQQQIRQSLDAATQPRAMPDDN